MATIDLLPAYAPVHPITCQGDVEIVVVIDVNGVRIPKFMCRRCRSVGTAIPRNKLRGYDLEHMKVVRDGTAKQALLF